jgi:nucleotide-binding universal stress UspA family protein
MNDKHPLSSVIVGIDGSQHAIRAAQWAVDEAATRGVPVRLISVIKAKHPSKEDYYADVHHAEASLRAAQAAVETAGTSVKFETAIVDGPPGAALIAESRDAELICVGSVGIGRYARSLLGSTASDLAEKAHCPVAIIRPQEDPPRQDINWIVVAVNDAPDNDAVVQYAMDEARLRKAPVLALGTRHDDAAKTPRDELDSKVQQWRERYPDVHVYPIANRADVVHFLTEHDERVQLAVIGASDAGQLARIVGPYGHPVFHHAESSVLVVRP